MSEIHEVGDIEISEDLDFLKKEWRFQRFGWFAMLLFVLLGLAGALGRGALAQKTIGDPATLQIDYERLVRHGADSEIELTIGPALKPDTVRVYVTAAYLHNFEIRNITPEPSSTGVRGDYVYYDIPRAQRDGPSKVLFILGTHAYWSVNARIFAEGMQPLEIRQTILP